MRLFLGSFTYESADGRPGRFQVLCEAKSESAAENRVRKKIRSFFEEKPEMWPVQVFLLEYIEVEAGALPVMMHFTRESAEKNSGPGSEAIFHSALPEQRQTEKSWTIEHAGEEAYIEIGS